MKVFLAVYLGGGCGLSNYQPFINIQVNNYEEQSFENISFLLLKQP